VQPIRQWAVRADNCPPSSRSIGETGRETPKSGQRRFIRFVPFAVSALAFLRAREARTTVSGFVGGAGGFYLGYLVGWLWLWGYLQ
jgi:hypothetical protein